MNNETCDNGAIRLQGGSNVYEGRIEVCQDQRWGTICDHLWDDADASVACRQLGFSSQGSLS